MIFDGEEKELQLTRTLQPALLAVSMAIVKIIEFELKKKTEFVEVVLGHSLGEYSALCSINCISQKVASAKILRIRGKAMQNAVKNIETSMVAVIGMELEQIEKEISQIEKPKIMFVR